jgi:alkanesulfonate monooxygenase SsuD/methylene tetrahydromethanopterin reductase-like flavin-dependent oxidoreductase (luciferase family)
MDVMYKLMESSWRDDAVVYDREKGVFSDPTRVREINHVGKYYSVPGPHICNPSLQRTPVLLQAGTSKAGKSFAAKHAEAVFVSGHSPEMLAQNIADIRSMAQSEFGRDPQNVKFLALVCPIIGRTEKEAHEKHREFIGLGSKEGALALFGGWTGIDLSKYGDDEELRYVESNGIRSIVEGWSKACPGVEKWTKVTLAEQIVVGGLCATIVGTTQQVANELERWVKVADLDGFNFVSQILFSNSPFMLLYRLFFLKQLA